MQCVIASPAVRWAVAALHWRAVTPARLQDWVEQKALALRSAEQHELFHRQSRAVRSFAC